MSTIPTTNEGAEVLRVYAENERSCGRFGIAKDLNDAADEIERMEAEFKRLRAFVQWVADHSNDPAVVREAKAHGAKP